MSKQNLILFAVAVLTVSSIILHGCGFFEQPYRYYESYDQSLHDGMWVPDIFPHDIVDIYEQHVIDTTEVWLRFSLSDEEFDPSKIGYEPIQSTQLSEIISVPMYTAVAETLVVSDFWKKSNIKR